jgi:hypothetical protein
MCTHHNILGRRHHYPQIPVAGQLVVEQLVQVLLAVEFVLAPVLLAPVLLAVEFVLVQVYSIVYY